MVVVFLISTLVGSAAIYYDEIIAQRKIGKARTELIQISKALKTYENKVGHPITEYVDVAGENRKFDLEDLVWSQVMQSVPDDPWSQEYALDAHRGVVICLGPDGLLGTADDLEHQFKPPFQAERVRYDSRRKMVIVSFSRSLEINSVSTATLSLENVGAAQVVTSVVDLRNMYEARIEVSGVVDEITAEVVIYPGLTAMDLTTTVAEQRIPLAK